MQTTNIGTYSQYETWLDTTTFFTASTLFNVAQGIALTSPVGISSYAFAGILTLSNLAISKIFSQKPWLKFSCLFTVFAASTVAFPYFLVMNSVAFSAEAAILLSGSFAIGKAAVYIFYRSIEAFLHHLKKPQTPIKQQAVDQQSLFSPLHKISAKYFPDLVNKLPSLHDRIRTINWKKMGVITAAGLAALFSTAFFLKNIPLSGTKPVIIPANTTSLSSALIPYNPQERSIFPFPEKLPLEFFTRKPFFFNRIFHDICPNNNCLITVAQQAIENTPINPSSPGAISLPIASLNSSLGQEGSLQALNYPLIAIGVAFLGLVFFAYKKSLFSALPNKKDEKNEVVKLSVTSEKQANLDTTYTAHSISFSLESNKDEVILPSSPLLPDNVSTQSSSAQILQEKENPISTSKVELDTSEEVDNNDPILCRARFYDERYTSSFILDENMEWNKSKAPNLNDFTLENGQAIPIKAGDYLAPLKLFNLENCSTSDTKLLAGDQILFFPGRLIRKLQQGDTLKLRYKTRPIHILIQNENPDNLEKKFTFQGLIDQTEYELLYPNGKAASHKPVFIKGDKLPEKKLYDAPWIVEKKEKQLEKVKKIQEILQNTVNQNNNCRHFSYENDKFIEVKSVEFPKDIENIGINSYDISPQEIEIKTPQIRNLYLSFINGYILVYQTKSDPIARRGGSTVTQLTSTIKANGYALINLEKASINPENIISNLPNATVDNRGILSLPY